MHTQPSPSAHVCTPPVARHITAKRNHHNEWNALSFAQQEVQARDQLLTMLDRAAWNSPELLALSYAVAVLTTKIQDRSRAQGGAA